MEESIIIKVSKDKKVEMIRSASQEFNRVLSAVEPPFNDKRDIVELRSYLRDSDRIILTYEILRGARPSKAEQNRSPYREKGLIMQSGKIR